MTGQIESLLDKGIEAARGYEHKRARDLLLHVIEIDQANEKAWLWLSSVVETPNDKQVCLENVLLINPDNTYAAMGLQHLRQQPETDLSPPSVLPRLGGTTSSVDETWGGEADQATPPPAVRICARCGFRNPGWAYLCDNCGANLRQMNIKETVREASQARGRGFVTLLQAWGGAFIFDRVYAFRPEIAIASIGRTTAALTTAAIFASIWRAVMSFVLWLLSTEREWDREILINAIETTLRTLPAALLLASASVPIALLTWGVARLAGGKQGFKAHLHLTAVAFSAWIILVAVLAPLTIVIPYLVGGDTGFDVPFDIITSLVSLAISSTAALWLMHAIRTAQDFSIKGALGTALLVTAASAAIFFIVDLATGGAFARFLSELVARPFLPLPNLALPDLGL